MTRKKERPTHSVDNEEKIPVGLSSRDFLRFYQSHPDAFETEGERKKGRNGRSGRKAGDKEGREREETSRTGEGGNLPESTSRDKKKRKNVGSEPGSRGKAVGLRVIGGKFKAIHLEYGGDHRVRPMKDRIRESVFNLLGPTVIGKHVIDLFAGTGALAIEALSRGAASATLIEIHFPTARIARRNIAALEEKEKGISERVTLTTTDVFFWGRELAATIETTGDGEKRVPFDDRYERLPKEIPWLVFCSPPYDFYVKREEEMLALLEAVRHAAPVDSVFVIEADERFDFDLLGVEIPEKKRRSYLPAEVGISTKDSL